MIGVRLLIAAVLLFVNCNCLRIDDKQWNEEKQFCGDDLMKSVQLVCPEKFPLDTSTADYAAKKAVLVDKCCKQKCSFRFIQDNVCAKVRTTRGATVPVTKYTQEEPWYEKRHMCADKLMKSVQYVCPEIFPLNTSASNYAYKKAQLKEKCCNHPCSFHDILIYMCPNNTRHTRSVTIPAVRDPQGMEWTQQNKFCGDDLMKSVKFVCPEKFPLDITTADYAAKKAILVEKCCKQTCSFNFIESSVCPKVRKTRSVTIPAVRDPQGMEWTQQNKFCGDDLMKSVKFVCPEKFPLDTTTADYAAKKAILVEMCCKQTCSFDFIESSVCPKVRKTRSVTIPAVRDPQGMEWTQQNKFCGDDLMKSVKFVCPEKFPLDTTTADYAAKKAILVEKCCKQTCSFDFIESSVCPKVRKTRSVTIPAVGDPQGKDWTQQNKFCGDDLMKSVKFVCPEKFPLDTTTADYAAKKAILVEKCCKQTCSFNFIESSVCPKVRKTRSVTIPAVRDPQGMEWTQQNKFCGDDLMKSVKFVCPEKFPLDTTTADYAAKKAILVEKCCKQTCSFNFIETSVCPKVRKTRSVTIPAVRDPQGMEWTQQNKFCGDDLMKSVKFVCPEKFPLDTTTADYAAKKAILVERCCKQTCSFDFIESSVCPKVRKTRSVTIPAVRDPQGMEWTQQNKFCGDDLMKSVKFVCPEKFPLDTTTADYAAKKAILVEKCCKQTCSFNFIETSVCPKVRKTRSVTIPAVRDPQGMEWTQQNKFCGDDLMKSVKFVCPEKFPLDTTTADYAAKKAILVEKCCKQTCSFDFIETSVCPKVRKTRSATIPVTRDPK